MPEIDPAIVDPGLARLVLWQMRVENRPSLIRQPKQIAHDALHRQNSMPDRMSQLRQPFDWVPKVVTGPVEQLGPSPGGLKEAVDDREVSVQQVFDRVMH